MERPRCNELGCINLAVKNSYVKANGEKSYGKKCSRHRGKPETYKAKVKRRSLANMGRNPNLFDELGDRRYREFKKSFCEKCGIIPEYSCVLDIDHINGNHADNRPENLQTLCANCHRIKTYLERLDTDNALARGANLTERQDHA